MPERPKLSVSLAPALHLAGAVVSFALASLAMFAAYQVLGSAFGLRAMGYHLLSVPPSLFASPLAKALEVALAVLVLHAVLKIAAIHRRDPAGPAAFALFVLVSAIVGFLASYNNAAEAGEYWRWLVFASAIFLSLSAIAALYLNSAGKCLRRMRDWHVKRAIFS